MRIGEISNMKGFFFYPQVYTDLTKLSLAQRRNLMDNQADHPISFSPISNMTDTEKTYLQNYLDNNNFPTHKHPHVDFPEYGEVPLCLEIYRG